VREVSVETIGKGTRTIKVGIDWDNIKKMERSYISSINMVCSPRISPQPTPWGCKSYTDTRCWKTLKKGLPKPKKSWQRHSNPNDLGPHSRRKKRGKRRGLSYPSVRTLNEMGRCIYPNMCC